jgi:hypothetical protein
MTFSKIISSKSKNIVKNNSEYLGILIPFVEMNFSKLINYSTDMCWNGQGTMVYNVSWEVPEEALLGLI